MSRSFWIVGSATFTIVASRMTMNCARQTRTRTSHGLTRDGMLRTYQRGAGLRGREPVGFERTRNHEETSMELIHTCYRITDPERSTAFYEALGLEKRRELPIRDEAMNYFFGVPGKPMPELELTYNFGVDSYELGTAYGHIALTVEDMADTLEKLAAQGIEPERAPYSVREGGSLLCFVRDPDDYRIELIERNDY